MTSTSSSKPILEGVFAISKPTAISSAQVIRDVQSHFTPSRTFKPWIDAEQARKDAESHNQKRKRKSWKQRQPMQVKMGHGGTLDPIATGVLILGVGNGTKSLNQFLECTKSYETVVLFGAATDTYDIEGKIVSRKPHQHITRELVEEALDRFRGEIMQRPPIFSALRVQGKRLYEYAREGKEVPVEIVERPMQVESLEMVDWYDGGTHDWNWPDREAEREEKEVVEKVLHFGADTGELRTEILANGHEDETPRTKRQRNNEAIGTIDADGQPAPKAGKVTSEPVSSGPIQDGVTTSTITAAAEAEQVLPSTEIPSCPAPACRLRMTVTSGFYVRSLCHDLGAAVGSLAIMTSLIRTRQANFQLGENVLSYEDMSQGEEVWGPKVTQMLEQWNAKEGRSPKERVSSHKTKVCVEDEEGADVRDVEQTAKAAARMRVRHNTSSDED